MATTMTVVGSTVFGNMRVVYGTFTNSGSSTGTTQTLGLGSGAILIFNDSAGLAGGLSYTAPTLTLTCTSTSSGGTWCAMGIGSAT